MTVEVFLARRGSRGILTPNNLIDRNAMTRTSRDESIFREPAVRCEPAVDGPNAPSEQFGMNVSRADGRPPVRRAGQVGLDRRQPLLV